MGMPSTKADCDKRIAQLKRNIAGYQAKIKGNNGYDKDYMRECIAKCKAEIAELQAHKKTLK